MNTAKKAGIALIIIGVLALGFIMIKGSSATSLGFSDMFDFSGSKVTCDVTVYNDLILNPRMSEPVCHLTDCTNLFSFWTFVGYTDKGTISMFVNEEEVDSASYIIDETQERSFTLTGKCLGKTVTQNIQLQLFDERGEKLSTKEVQLKS